MSISCQASLCDSNHRGWLACRWELSPTATSGTHKTKRGGINFSHHHGSSQEGCCPEKKAYATADASTGKETAGKKKVSCNDTSFVFFCGILFVMP